MTATAAGGSGLTVAALAREAQVTPDTVRYYERIGLLPPPTRNESGYRQFPAEAIDRLLFIQGSQRFGLRLREIKELLAVRDTGRCPCEPAEGLLRRPELHGGQLRLLLRRCSDSRLVNWQPRSCGAHRKPWESVSPTAYGRRVTNVRRWLA